MFDRWLNAVLGAEEAEKQAAVKTALNELPPWLAVPPDPAARAAEKVRHFAPVSKYGPGLEGLGNIMTSAPRPAAAAEKVLAKVVSKPPPIPAAARVAKAVGKVVTAAEKPPSEEKRHRIDNLGRSPMTESELMQFAHELHRMGAIRSENMPSSSPEDREHFLHSDSFLEPFWMHEEELRKRGIGKPVAKRVGGGYYEDVGFGDRSADDALLKRIHDYNEDGPVISWGPKARNNEEWSWKDELEFNKARTEHNLKHGLPPLHPSAGEIKAQKMPGGNRAREEAAQRYYKLHMLQDHLNELKARGEKTAAKLTQEHREDLPTKQFAVPERKAKRIGVAHEIKGEAKGKYPVHDRVHARAALSYVSRFGTPEEKALVRAKVHSKYPDIGKEKTALTPLEAGLTAGGTLFGGITGRAVGGHIGSTPEEQSRNRRIGSVVGALGGGALGYGGGRGLSSLLREGSEGARAVEEAAAHVPVDADLAELNAFKARVAKLQNEVGEFAQQAEKFPVVAPKKDTAEAVSHAVPEEAAPRQKMTFTPSPEAAEAQRKTKSLLTNLKADEMFARAEEDPRYDKAVSMAWRHPDVLDVHYRLMDQHPKVHPEVLKVHPDMRAAVYEKVMQDPAIQELEAAAEGLKTKTNSADPVAALILRVMAR